MKEQFSRVRWKRVNIAIGVGVALVLVATTAYANLKRRDGWCVRFSSNSSESILYGAECQIPRGSEESVVEN
jgi:hypothetical protein